MIDKESFIINYTNQLTTDFEEDYLLFKTFKRIINSYYKAPNEQKFHSMYNKIFILRRVFKEEFIYTNLVESMAYPYTKNLISYILNELFGQSFEIDEVEDVWEEHINYLLKKNLIKKEGNTPVPLFYTHREGY